MNKFYLNLFAVTIMVQSGCDMLNADSTASSTATAEVRVQIPEGNYESTEELKHRKTVAGKAIQVLTQLGENELFLNDVITVRDGKIYSNTAGGAKEIEIQSGSDEADSVFFGEMPTAGGTVKQIQINLTAEKHLVVYIDKKVMEYRPK